MLNRATKFLLAFGAIAAVAVVIQVNLSREKPAEGSTARLTETPKVPAVVSAEAPAEAPTDASTEAPAEASTDAAAQASTDASAEATTVRPRQRPTDSPTKISRDTPPEALKAALAEAAAESPERGKLLAQALATGRDGDWTAAAELAQRSADPIAADILLWSRLRDGLGDWQEYRGFLLRNADWPNMGTIHTRAETNLPTDLSPTLTIWFFRGGEPETGTGSLRLADAYVAKGMTEEAEAELVRGWREAAFGASEQETTLARHAELLEPHHIARLDRLLWEGRSTEAKRMLSLVDEDQQALAEARLAVRGDVDGSTMLIRAVAPALRSNPGLAFERYLYRVNKGRWDEAEEHMLMNSTSAAKLGEPDYWMDRRANLARQYLRRGDVNKAYRVAAQNFGSEGAAFADSEWLAGFIALEFMDDPELATGHFERFRDTVGSPISVGRAGYWLGLAQERAGNEDAAQEAYELGALHQTSFYGQLAAEHAGIAPDANLAAPVPATNEAFKRRTVVQAAEALSFAGEEGLFRIFMRAAADGQPPEVQTGLAQMANDLGQPQIGVRIGKDAASGGLILPDAYYPLHEIAKTRWKVPTEYALAIARQESEMNPGARSPVGALGLMQLMPGTAEQMAGLADVAYDPTRLGRDAGYNARLGTEYLARMLNRYEGSYVLATAAYNAGPGRVNEWILAYGDPRRDDVDVINWIEGIPFTETRNYVMRVLEGLFVYRVRLKGEPVPIRLEADINRTAEAG